jgi:hypothetical protein
MILREVDPPSTSLVIYLYIVIDISYFLNIPSHAPIIYTLKSTKFTLKHLRFAPTCFCLFLDHLQGARGHHFMQLPS